MSEEIPDEIEGVDYFEETPLTLLEAAQLYCRPGFDKHERALEAQKILSLHGKTLADETVSDLTSLIGLGAACALKEAMVFAQSQCHQLETANRDMRRDIQNLNTANAGMRKATLLVAEANGAIKTLEKLRAEGSVPAALEKMNFVLQYGCHCPSKFLVRLPRPGTGHMDFKDYLKSPANGGTCDIIAFGKTFQEAAEAAMKQYEDAQNLWIHGQSQNASRMDAPKGVRP